MKRQGACGVGLPERALLLCAALLFGCAGGLEDEARLPALDEPYFRCNVRPVLVKSCAALACHGDVLRYFRVFGRNRLRYALAESDRNALLQPEEEVFDFDAARAYVDAADPESSLLLLKPLDASRGGYYHGGAEVFRQGDVFLSRDDADYRTLLAWVKGAKEKPTCVEPGSDQ
jgi:hypothetical protein